MIPAPLHGQAGHWGAQTGTAVARALLYISWLFLRNSVKRGVVLGSGWLPALHQKGSRTPATTSVLMSPHPALLQAKVWPGFCLPISFSSSRPPFCA